MTSREDVVETFRCSAELSDLLNNFSRRYDLSKSELIRVALAEHFRTLELLESEVWGAVMASMVRNSTKKKASSQS